MTSISKHDTSESDSEMLKPGTTILSCEPFIYVTSFHASSPLQVCDTCLWAKKTGLLRCKSCQTVWYCNRTCQKKGWEDGHKHECKGLPALLRVFGFVPGSPNHEIIARPRLMLRAFMKLQDGNDYYDELDVGGVKVKRRFWDLISRSEGLLDHVLYLKDLEILLRGLKVLIQPNSKIKIPPKAELTEIFERINLNVTDIGNGATSVGAGVYLGSSMLKNSCNPMAVHVFEGRVLRIRSIVEIPKSLPIDQITTVYTNPLMPFQTVRHGLMEIYQFKCVCGMSCESGQLDKKMRSIICSNSGCNSEICTDDMKKPCTGCGNVMEMVTINQVLETQMFAIRLIGSALSLAQIEPIIQRMKSLNFSDSHWVMIKLYQKAAQVLHEDPEKSITKFAKAYEYDSKTISGLRSCLSPYDRRFKWLLFNLCWTAIQLEKLNDAEMYFQEFKSIGDVLYGENSVFIRNRIQILEDKIYELKTTAKMKQFTF